MTREDYADALKAIGHYHGAIVRMTSRKNAGRFYFECECGYRSASRATMKDGIETALHHRKLMLKEYRERGVSMLELAARVR